MRRITVTLDDHVAALIAERVHRDRTTVKQVVNDAARTALTSPAARATSYRSRVHHAELAPGINLAGFHKLADEVEDGMILEHPRQPWPSPWAPTGRAPTARRSPICEPRGGPRRPRRG